MQQQPLSPESAAAIWQRAAQLQAEAAQRLEERSRALSASAGSPDHDPHDFSVDEVRAAAVEAGIAPEFVALALAEHSADGIGPLRRDQQDAATRFLGTPERLLELSRTVDQPIDVVYASLQRVLPAPPWNLALRDIAGDPLNGGSLVFAVPPLVASSMGAIPPLMYNAHAVDVQQLQLMLIPLTASGGRSCDIVLRAGLQRSVRRNFRFGRWSAGIMAVVGGGTAAGGAVALGLTGALIVLPVVAGAAVVGAGTTAGYRALYRSYLRKFTANLNDMLGAIAVDAKTGGSFAPRLADGRVAPRLPDGSRED